MLCSSCRAEFAATEWRRLDHYVASDCQPVRADLELAECQSCGHVQKAATPVWSATCDAIYANYRIYHQAAGSEQKARSISGGGLAGRSVLITEFLKTRSILPEQGDIVDIGCGNGAFLKAFHAAMPDWRIHGAEINRTFETDVLGVCAGARFWDPDRLGETDAEFHLVTLIHCLEHIPSPVDYLRNIRRLLAADGVLLVQVPDVENNPFDLCIADHASHFSAATLARIVQRAGFHVEAVGNFVLGKELTLIARSDDGADGRESDAPLPQPFLDAQLEALRLAERTTATLAEDHPVGIFGSSIAASWLASALGDRVVFFVDEDPDRIGREHMGRPILAPDTVPRDAVVVCALAPRLAQAISARMTDLPWRLVSCWLSPAKRLT